MNRDKEILIVDDDENHRIMLKTLLTGWGYRITEADDGSQAIEIVREQVFDLILMDIRMVKVSGIEALKEIKAYNPAIPVVIMTAYSSVKTAIEALKNGAYDYLTKPIDFDKLKLVIERATEHSHLKAENRKLKEQISHQYSIDKIIGRSQVMEKLLETVKQVVGDPRVEIEITRNSPGSSSPMETDFWSAIEGTLKRAAPDVVLLPYQSAGGTDSGFFRRRGAVCYGADPFFVTEDEWDTVHGNDERLRIESLDWGLRWMYLLTDQK